MNVLEIRDLFMRKSFFLLFFIACCHFQLFAQRPDSTNSFKRFRLGSYGESLFQHMDYGPDRYSDPAGAPSDNRSLIGIPRMNLSIDYNFTPKISITSEIEFEYGGTGAAMELEYEEAGEYEAEIEKGGEVALEQMFLTRKFSDAFQIRIGHMVVPVGQTNNRHVPTLFFGTIRPEGEYSIIPMTWHETGISIMGYLPKWYYEFQLVNGLDPNGFSSPYWIKRGRQAAFENVKMTNPAWTGRIENTSVKNLRLGMSGYYGNTGKNATKPEKMKNLKGTVSIISGEAEYNDRTFILRANMLHGNLSDSYQISSINKTISSATQYLRSPVAKTALTWAVESGYNVFSFLRTKEKLFPFARYEYYNSMESTEKGMLADARYKRHVLTLGMNYYFLPNAALKTDYSMREIGSGQFNNENTFGIALVYTGWLIRQ